MQKIEEANERGDKTSLEGDLKRLIEQAEKKLSGDLSKAKEEIGTTTNHLEK